MKIGTKRRKYAFQRLPKKGFVMFSSSEGFVILSSSEWCHSHVTGIYTYKYHKFELLEKSSCTYSILIQVDLQVLVHFTLGLDG